jgi:glycerophosphoryl diester phosphodiesterase
MHIIKEGDILFFLVFFMNYNDIKSFFVCLLFSSLIIGGCMAKPIVIAHRGNSSYAPENTLASFNATWQVDSDAVELDIHLTSDNQIVVIHDEDTQRTSGQKLIVAETTYAELSKLDVGSFKAAYFKDERVPLLKDAIATVQKNKKLFIEIKCDKKIVPLLREVIKQSGKKAQITIIAFDLETLAEAKKVMPDIPMCWLISAEQNEKTKEYLPYDKSFIDLAVEKGIDGLDLDYGVLTQEYVHQVHKAGLSLYVWTVDNLQDSGKMQNFQVDGITTNYPADTMLYLKGLLKD